MTILLLMILLAVGLSVSRLGTIDERDGCDWQQIASWYEQAMAEELRR